MINSKELLPYTKDLNLLFVEDHQELCEHTADILKNFFKSVDTVNDGESALELYQKKSYDIVLTDIRMPKMDGVELTKHLYAIKPSQAVIILSAHDESSYLIPLINLGVSQFIQKPIDYQELLKVLYNIAKTCQINEQDLSKKDTIINLQGGFTYDQINKMLKKDNEVIYLTKFEILFLDLLGTIQNKIFSNDDIVHFYKQNNENIDPQNIRKLVSKLRKKISQDSIESIYGVGYRLVSTSM